LQERGQVDQQDQLLVEVGLDPLDQMIRSSASLVVARGDGRGGRAELVAQRAAAPGGSVGVGSVELAGVQDGDQLGERPKLLLDVAGRHAGVQRQGIDVVRDAVAVRVRAARIGAELHLAQAVGQAVPVGVELQRIRAAALGDVDLGPVEQAIVVRIGDRHEAEVVPGRDRIAQIPLPPAPHFGQPDSA